jgi:hypothetical protein
VHLEGQLNMKQEYRAQKQQHLYYTTKTSKNILKKKKDVLFITRQTLFTNTYTYVQFCPT